VQTGVAEQASCRIYDSETVAVEFVESTSAAKNAVVNATGAITKSAIRKLNNSDINPIIGGASKKAVNDIIVIAATLSAANPGRRAAAVTASGYTIATPIPLNAAPNIAITSLTDKANNAMPAAAATPDT